MISVATEYPVEVVGFTLLLRRSRPRRRDLLVSLSTKQSFALYRKSFGCDMLFVTDSRIAYYVHSSLELAEKILQIADRGRYRRIMIVGGSKAGFGALLIGGLCARMRPDRTIRVLAFQPRAFIWPYERGRAVPSYHRAFVRAANDPAMRRNMRRYGDASFVGELPNAIVRIVYPERNEVDKAQALSLTGPNVSHISVPTSIHNTLGFLNLLNKPEHAIREAVDKMFGPEAADDGLSASASERERTVRDILAKPDIPSIDDMVKAVFALEPQQAPRGWRARVIVRRVRRMAYGLLDLLRPYPTAKNPDKPASARTKAAKPAAAKPAVAKTIDRDVPPSDAGAPVRKKTRRAKRRAALTAGEPVRISQSG